MQDQPITRRQPAEVVVQQGTANGATAQHTQSQLAQFRTVARIGLAEADLTYLQLQAYLALEGRDEHHEQWLQTRRRICSPATNGRITSWYRWPGRILSRTGLRLS